MDAAGHVLTLMAADFGIMVMIIRTIRTKLILNLGLQRAASVYGNITIRNMQCRAGFREDLVVSLQCNVGTGASLHINRIIAAFDIDILNGHVCGRILGRIDRDCVARLRGTLRNHRSLILHGRAASLRYRLSGIACIHGNGSISKIPVSSIRCHRKAHTHDQCDHTCCQLFHFHRCFPPLLLCFLHQLLQGKFVVHGKCLEQFLHHLLGNFADIKPFHETNHLMDLLLRNVIGSKTH